MSPCVGLLCYLNLVHLLFNVSCGLFFTRFSPFRFPLTRLSALYCSFAFSLFLFFSFALLIIQDLNLTSHLLVSNLMTSAGEDYVQCSNHYCLSTAFVIGTRHTVQTVTGHTKEAAMVVIWEENTAEDATAVILKAEVMKVAQKGQKWPAQWPSWRKNLSLCHSSNLQGTHNIQCVSLAQTCTVAVWMANVNSECGLLLGDLKNALATSQPVARRVVLLSGSTTATACNEWVCELTVCVSSGQVCVWGEEQQQRQRVVQWQRKKWLEPVCNSRQRRFCATACGQNSQLATRESENHLH